MSLFDLTGKTALVTGASSGMGKAIALALGSHNANVIVSSNDAAGCKEVTRELTSKGSTAFDVKCDVTRPEEIDALVEHSIRKAGQINILISCVGVEGPVGFAGIDAVSFSKVMQINLQSALYLTQRILPQMVEIQDGVIIYLASIAAVRGNKNIGLYGLSKAGLVQLARNLAVEYGPDNIRVNSISPGLIETPFSKSLLSKKSFMERRLSLTPLRRVGRPEEVAGVAVLLASKAGAFITGQNIIVDGGTTINDGSL